MSQLSISAADLAAMRGMSPQERRDYIAAVQGGIAPPKRNFLPQVDTGGTKLGGRFGAYVADHPLKHVANAVASFKNNRTMRDDNRAQEKAYKQRQMAGGKLADALANADLSKASNKSGFVHLGNGVMFDPTTGQEVTSQAFEASAKTKHDRALERIQAGQRVPASVNKQLAETATKANAGDTLITDLQNTPGAYNVPKDLAIEVAGSIHPSLANIGREFLYGDPEQQGVRERASKWTEDIRRDLAGANLTQMESVLGQQWDPSQAGISQETAIRRFQALNDYLKQNHANLTGQFGGQPSQAGQAGQPGAQPGQPGAQPGPDVFTPPPQTPQQTGSGPQVGETIEMPDGTYQFNGAEWEKLGG